MWHFVSNLFDTSEFQSRHAGPGWSEGLVWLHNVSDLLIWLAFLAISAVLFYFVRRRKHLPFSWMFWMFGAFIISCGFTHFMEAFTGSVPAYRLAGVMKLVTAVISWATVIALIPLVPKALALRSTEELEQEINERRRAEERSRRCAAEIADLYNEAPCGYHSLDAEGRFVQVNDTELGWLGYSRDEVIGRKFTDLITPASSEVFEQSFPLLHEHGGVNNIEVDLVRKDGAIRSVLLSAKAVKNGGHSPTTRATLFDITDRKIAEAKVRKLLDTAPDAILIVNRDGQIVLANSQAETLFGYTKTELHGNPADMLVPERFRDAHPRNGSGYYSRHTLQPRLVKRELFGLRKDGSEFPIEVSLSPLETEEGVLFTSAIRDISDRKQTEADLARHTAQLSQSEEAYREQSKILRSILDSISDGVIVANDRGKFLLINPGAEQVLGQSQSEGVTGTWTKRSGLFLPDKKTPYPIDKLPLMLGIHGHSVDDAEMFVRHAGVQEGMWVSANARPLRDDQGKLRGGVVVFRDITQRKEAETALRQMRDELEKRVVERTAELAKANRELHGEIAERLHFEDRLRGSLREKEVLLREIHHRVKNNLQVVCSLLKMHSQHIQDPGSLEVFRECQDRVKSMALIHEKLYRFGDLARIDFADYTRSLAGYLFHAYAVDSDAISLTLNIDPVLLPLDAVMPCALLIHELVANSLKHAFPGGKGDIFIDFHTADQRSFTLVVRDNGVGCSADFRVPQESSLGAQLVTALVDQLDGTLELEQAHGFSCKITFALADFSDRGHSHDECTSASR